MAIISVGSRNREIWDSWETDCSKLTRVRLEIKGGPELIVGGAVVVVRRL